MSTLGGGKESGSLELELQVLVTHQTWLLEPEPASARAASARVATETRSTQAFVVATETPSTQAFVEATETCSTQAFVLATETRSTQAFVFRVLFDQNSQCFGLWKPGGALLCFIRASARCLAMAVYLRIFLTYPGRSNAQVGFKLQFCWLHAFGCLVGCEIFFPYPI